MIRLSYILLKIKCIIDQNIIKITVQNRKKFDSKHVQTSQPKSIKYEFRGMINLSILNLAKVKSSKVISSQLSKLIN